jgi:hypothetical protein
METKKKVFDAVAESRKWRETTSRRLDAMTPEQRLVYLHNLGERCRAQIRQHRVTPAEAVS